MSTGAGFFGEEPGTGSSPRPSGEGAPPGQPAPDAGEHDEATFADVLNGLTLDSGRGRRRKDKKSKKDKRKQPGGTEPEMAEPQTAEPEVTGQHEQTTHAVWPESDSEYEPEFPRQHPPRPHPPAFGPDDFETDLEETAIVRPYAWTGGRTKANHKLELETLVSSTERAFTEAGPLQVEHRSMVDICRQPRSVAEVAALLGVPLGVARVLISDVADLGLVAVHETTSEDESAEARLTLMERVLSGLRRL